ncbi:MAG TPA: iron-containing alcohol dehydrogenase [Gaiellaceae bacterium]|nr:iron-containing alcohol dehydrogenase [Gaiellaceae bacterium]
MIVRWSLTELRGVLEELGLERPFLVASPRWRLDVPVCGRWPEVPSPGIEVPEEADSLLAMGGGSAIDTAKNASSQTGLPLVSVPTTYSGAEWTPGFGIRSPERLMLGGGGGASLAAIVYDVELTLGLPRAETVGTALNALAHCAEALYVTGRNAAADRRALEGAALIGEWLPAVVERPADRGPRSLLLRGAAAAGEALALAGLGVGHALAQALGGRYGLPHGTMNALCLPPALRFAAEQAPEAVERFRTALGGRTVEALAGLGDFGRLRDLGVPEGELPALAAAAAGRRGNANMPRPATAAELEQLLRSIY